MTRGWSTAKIAVGILVVAMLVTGCASNSESSSTHADYTCSQLAADFGTPGDAPSDRGQLVVDSIVSRVKDHSQASDNVRDEVVYALATACAQSSPSSHPVAPALSAVQRIYRGR